MINCVSLSEFLLNRVIIIFLGFMLLISIAGVAKCKVSFIKSELAGTKQGVEKRFQTIEVENQTIE